MKFTKYFIIACCVIFVGCEEQAKTSGYYEANPYIAGKVLKDCSRAESLPKGSQAEENCENALSVAQKVVNDFSNDNNKIDIKRQIYHGFANKEVGFLDIDYKLANLAPLYKECKSNKHKKEYINERYDFACKIVLPDFMNIIEDNDFINSYRTFLENLRSDIEGYIIDIDTEEQLNDQAVASKIKAKFKLKIGSDGYLYGDILECLKFRVDFSELIVKENDDIGDICYDISKGIEKKDPATQAVRIATNLFSLISDLKSYYISQDIFLENDWSMMTGVSITKIQNNQYVLSNDINKCLTIRAIKEGHNGHILKIEQNGQANKKCRRIYEDSTISKLINQNIRLGR